MIDRSMTCYDWKYCWGDCSVCDLYLDRQIGRRFYYLHARRWFMRLLEGDCSLGHVRHLRDQEIGL